MDSTNEVIAIADTVDVAVETPQPKTVIQLGGVNVDLTRALPLILDDWFALEEVGVTMETMTHPSLKVMFEMAKYVVHKADPAIDVDAVRKLRLAELSRIFSIVGEAESAPVTNRPSTTCSTS